MLHFPGLLCSGSLNAALNLKALYFSSLCAFSRVFVLWELKNAIFSRFLVLWQFKNAAFFSRIIVLWELNQDREGLASLSDVSNPISLSPTLRRPSVGWTSPMFFERDTHTCTHTHTHTDTPF